MKIELTPNVKNHHTNQDYPTLRVRWSELDRNFDVDGEGPNWCPKDAEVLQLVNELLLVSPTFYERLAKVVRIMDKVHVR